MIEPGATIGILGGGQLGRMTALAAAALGYRCHVFCPQSNGPAKQVSAYATTAAYDDTAALAKFAAAVDVITFEFENVPADTAEILAAAKPVRPAPDALRIAQDRLREKDFLRSIGAPTAPYLAVDGAAALQRALREIGPEGVLKTVRGGYDGKGQATIRNDTDLAQAWRSLGADAGILERFIEFDCEISVIVARGLDGRRAAYVPVENRHVEHILDTTIAPARIASEIGDRAEVIAQHIADRLDLVGLLAVEMFVTAAGEVLVNEIAPRPHNSGHWTIDACYHSQFEQLVRAICGLPLGSAERHSDAVMKNLIGTDVGSWRAALDDPAAKLHLYGKTQALPRRKMGHVTRLTPRR
jgi:5-(carboxyamino)imidazole ribonucleotide synthase